MNKSFDWKHISMWQAKVTGDNKQTLLKYKNERDYIVVRILSDRVSFANKFASEDIKAALCELLDTWSPVFSITELANNSAWDPFFPTDNRIQILEYKCYRSPFILTKCYWGRQKMYCRKTAYCSMFANQHGRPLLLKWAGVNFDLNQWQVTIPLPGLLQATKVVGDRTILDNYVWKKRTYHLVKIGSATVELVEGGKRIIHNRQIVTEASKPMSQNRGIIMEAAEASVNISYLLSPFLLILLGLHLWKMLQ